MAAMTARVPRGALWLSLSLLAVAAVRRVGAAGLCEAGSTTCPEYCGVAHSHQVRRDLEAKGLPAPPPNTTLQQVIAVIRHGSRTQAWAEPCWTDDGARWECDVLHVEGSTANTSDEGAIQFQQLVTPDPRQLNGIRGSCFSGQLLPAGYDAESINGRLLREFFEAANFTSGFTPDSVYLRSTNVPRTKASGQTLVKELFSGSRFTRWNWNTMEASVDDLTGSGVRCPRFKSVNQAWGASKGFAAIVVKYPTVLAQLVALKGADATPDFLTLLQLFDCILVHTCNNEPVPTGITPDVVTSVVKLLTELLIDEFEYESLGKLSMGFVIQNISDFMQASVAGAADAKRFVLYSGHDNTVAPLLSALGLLRAWPRYATLVTFELYGVSPTETAVRLVVNGEVQDVQHLCATGYDSQTHLCPTPSLQASLRALVPSAADCAAPPPSPTPPPPSPPTPSPPKFSKHAEVELAGGAGLITGLLAGVFGTLIGLRLRRRGSRSADYEPVINSL